MHDDITYFILRHMLGYIDDYQLEHNRHLMTLGIQVRLLLSWLEHVQQCYATHAYVTPWSTT